MRTRSIRFRLTVWHAGLLTAVFVALAGVLFVHLRGYLENELAQAQLRRARQIAETLVPSAARGDSSLLGRQIPGLYAPEKSDRFIRVTAGDGRVLYRSGAPNDLSFDPAAVPPAPRSPKAESVRNQRMPGGGSALVIAAVTSPAAGWLVEVGTSAAPVEALFSHLLLLLLLGLPLVVLAAAAGGYAVVGRALLPVERMTGKAAQITQHNLSERLPVEPTGDELERLSIALNHMIHRLEDAILNSKRFVADASHELRTPLTVVRGELEVLAQEKGAPAALRDTLGSLLEEVERLSKIVERLFALSRLDAGEAQAEWVRFDLRALAAGVAEQMTVLAEDKGVFIACSAGPSVPVEGDRARLKQVVVNLLDNAIKYTPSGGAIRVDAAAVDGHARLDVTDTGAGIPPEALPHVFDRFFRADPSRSSEREGAGLGLAIVKSICNAHGGKVEVESTPGRGSSFRVKLPLPKAEVPAKT